MKKLDLHGIFHIDVENTVKRFIEDNWANDEDVEIITGNSPDMTSLVLRVLKSYKLAWRYPKKFGIFERTSSIIVIMD